MVEIDKLSIIKNFKLTAEKIEKFEQIVQNIKKKPIVEELTPNGESKLSIESLLVELLEINMISLELEIEYMKNTLAAHLEHDLERETMDIQMQEKISGMMKKFGLG